MQLKTRPCMTCGAKFRAGAERVRCASCEEAFEAWLAGDSERPDVYEPRNDGVRTWTDAAAGIVTE